MESVTFPSIKSYRILQTPLYNNQVYFIYIAVFPCIGLCFRGKLKNQTKFKLSVSETANPIQLFYNKVAEICNKLFQIVYGGKLKM